MDNCSTNDVMVPRLKEKLYSTWNLLDGKLLHIRSYVHILNLIVKDVLFVIVVNIERIYDSVLYWSGSIKRYETFEETTNQLHVQYAKKLCLDCLTRWHSTYLMLSTNLLYKNVFTRLKCHDPKYKYRPSEDDWAIARKLCDKLMLFYQVTELLSGTKYPTTISILQLISFSQRFVRLR